jgi:hypothetical protein
MAVSGIGEVEGLSVEVLCMDEAPFVPQDVADVGEGGSS